MNTIDKISAFIFCLMVLISIIFTFLVSWTCIFTLPVELYGFYLLYTHLYEGRFHYSICKEYEERIKKKYDTNFSPLIIEVSKILQNKYLFWSIVYGFLLIFAAIYIPFLNHTLGTVPLKASYWLLVLGVGIITIFWVEITKFVKTKNPQEK